MPKSGPTNKMPWSQCQDDCIRCENPLAACKRLVRFGQPD